MRLKTARNILLVILLISALSLVILFTNLEVLAAIGDNLISKDQLVPVDVVHVIAGDDYRTEYAIELYKQGLAKYIFFTGGWCETHGWYHGAHGQELALNQGVPPEAIKFDDRTAPSTYTEVVILKEWMQNSPEKLKSVIAVSDPFHMRRVKWIFGDVFGSDTRIITAPVPFENTPFKTNWWSDLRSARYVIAEYIKYLYYQVRY